MSIELLNIDCLEYMKGVPDKYFELAIVDPPYGIGQDGTLGIATTKTKGFTFTKKSYEQKGWDKEIPPEIYFDELFRISINQIIWGGNYFIKLLPHFKNFIYWHKKGKSGDDKFNEGEVAFISNGRSRMVDIWWNGFGTINSGEERTHPTQKPVKLYKWLLHNYAKPGDKILDTHGGSMSIAIACHQMGFDLTLCEIDKDYYDAGVKRFKEQTMQQSLFNQGGNDERSVATKV